MTLRDLQKRFLRSERGTAMTEFVIFLPIWIIVFVAVVNLGQVGITGTLVQLRAQRELWDKAIEVTSQFAGGADHMSAPVAAVATAAEYGRVANLPGNDQDVNDGIEAVATGVGLGLGGHFGESCEKAFIPASLAVPSEIRLKCLPDDVLDMDEQDRYPYKITSDATASNIQALGGSSSILGILSSLMQTSGTVQAVGAGIRYGSDFTDQNQTQNLASTWSDVNAGAHNDVLVSPRALADPASLFSEASLVPFTVAFFMFKADEEYDEFLMFGSDNWEGDTEDNSMTPGSDCSNSDGSYNSDCGGVESESEERCDEARSESNYDPDCEPDPENGVTCPPEPDWWDECGF